MKEIWKDIPGFEGYYQASSLGRIKSVKRSVERRNNHKNGIWVYKSKIIKPRLSTWGYYQVSLYTEHGRNQPFVHRIIAFTFIENPRNKPQVNHKNGIKTDNRIENLEWCTHSENNKHAYDAGLKKGITKRKYKLSDENVLYIRKNKNITGKELAKKFNVSESAISNIRLRKAKKYIY